MNACVWLPAVLAICHHFKCCDASKVPNSQTVGRKSHHLRFVMGLTYHRHAGYCFVCADCSQGRCFPRRSALSRAICVSQPHQRSTHRESAHTEVLRPVEVTSYARRHGRDCRAGSVPLCLPAKLWRITPKAPSRNAAKPPQACMASCSYSCLDVNHLVRMCAFCMRPLRSGCSPAV